MAVSLVLLTVASYWPALRNGFIWDDDSHITNNPHLRGLAGLLSLWTTSAARICPLALTSFWLQHSLWGLVPWPYHLVNILMHAASGVALWQVLRALKVRGAWFGAALWVLHPVAVESVAWITELKNTQSALFYLLSIWFFLKWRQAAAWHPQKGAWAVESLYAMTLLCGALAMASKSSTVILPLVLALCAWWVEGRWGWRMVARLGPFFLCSTLSAVLSMWTQKLEGALDSAYARSGPERLVVAGKVVWFYLAKLIWPHPLVFIYPRWEVDASRAGSYLALAAVVATSLVLRAKRKTWGRPAFFAWAYFLIALLPVLGLLDHYFLRYSFVGDHFQYLASIGPLALAGAGLSVALDLVGKGNRLAKPIVCGMLLVVLGGLTWGRTLVFRDDETLWRDTLVKNPACSMAHNNLGTGLNEKGESDEAIREYQEAIRLKPDNAEAHNNLGVALGKKGQIDEAIRQYQEALRLEPGYAETHYNLGLALGEKGQIDEAIRQYQEAIRLKPDYAETHYNLGNALLKKDQTDEAIRQYQEAIRLKPDYAETHYNLGNTLLKKGQTDEAISQYQAAIRLKPDNAEAHINLGNTLLKKGQMDEAISQLQEAIRLKPDLAGVHYNLGIALGMKGQMDEAIYEYQEALRLKPDYAGARRNLEAALATKAGSLPLPGAGTNR
jgi:protein O-mannosyl-transferase